MTTEGSYAEQMPRVRAEVVHKRVWSGVDYGFDLEMKRAHNTFTYGELTLADLYVLRGAIQKGIDAIEKGEL